MLGFARKLIIVCLAISLCVPTYSRSAHADLLGDLAGIVTDPLKFGKMSENFKDAVLQALSQINALADKANGIAKARLEQLKGIVDDAIQGGVAAEQLAFDELMKLENKIYNDIQTILTDVQCATIVAAEGTLQSALIAALKNIAATQPTLSILNIPVAKLSTSSPPDLPKPDVAFYKVRDEVKARLDAIKDTDRAYEIVSAYGNLEALAKRTRCFYNHQEFEKQFIREESFYRVKQQSWFAILNVVN
jgi:hypothetical protein